MISVEREGLLKACEIVKPALATKDFIEELCFLWFDGKTVTAYNDTTFGIQAPFKSGLRGGFRGTIFLGLLSNSSGKKVEIDPAEDGDKLVAKIKVVSDDPKIRSSTNLKLAMFDESKAIHKIPKQLTKPVKLPMAFYDALRAAMISVAPTSAVPDQSGISLIHEAGVLNVYATDAKTISWVRIPKIELWPRDLDRVIFPLQFVEALIKLNSDLVSEYNSKKSDIATEKAGKNNKELIKKLTADLEDIEDKLDSELHLSKDEAMVVTSVDVKIFTRLIESPNPLDFAGVMKSAQKGQLLTIPERLDQMLARSAVMLDGQQEQAVDVGIADDLLNLKADTFFGQLKDQMKMGEHAKSVSLRINPDLIKRALPFCNEIGFSPTCITMKGNNFLHLIASYES